MGDSLPAPRTDSSPADVDDSQQQRDPRAAEMFNFDAGSHVLYFSSEYHEVSHRFLVIAGRKDDGGVDFLLWWEEWARMFGKIGKSLQ